MDHLPNKRRKAHREEGELQNRLRYAGTKSPTRPPLVCDGCGMDGSDHWKKDGTFIRLFSISGNNSWEQGRIVCEYCLQRLIGMDPNAIPRSSLEYARQVRGASCAPLETAYRLHRTRHDGPDG